MPTYRFEDSFSVDIVDPAVTANVDTIAVQPTLNTISVDIELTNANGKVFGYRLENISVSNLTYEGYDNLMLRVNERLNDFII